MIRYLLLILFLTKLVMAPAQKPAYNKVTIRLLNAQHKTPIGYSHIYNESKRFGAISDSAGYLNITAQPGDTIVFMALGYLGKYHVLSSSDADSTTIELVPRKYVIEEVKISIPRDYAGLKKAILNLDIDSIETKPIAELPQYNHYITPQLLDTNVVENLGFTIMHPVSGLYYRYSKVEKSKRKVWELQQQEMKQARVDAKYNREIVSRVTGLTGNELNQFIGYCNFSFNYLFETTPYDILVAIENKYNDYKAKQEIEP